MQHITLFEREVIEVGLRTKKGVRAIAKSLNRDHRVIQREVDRNSSAYRPYTAIMAQQMADEREKKRHLAKLEKYKNQRLKQYVVDMLKDDWSPEQIAGSLHRQPPDHLKNQHISCECIYQFIYNGDGRWENLWPHLRRARKRRQTQRSRKSHKIVIPERVSIHYRPQEINAKQEIGHWEADILEGKRSQKLGLSVQYERKTQLARLHRVEDKSAEETLSAIRQSVESLPQDLWGSITFDNGCETARHYQLREDFNLATFHCDAYASWQKGGVENLNGLIRQYLPKGADFSKITNERIQIIQEKLNNRPRKSLNYKTPNQIIAQEVGH